MQEISSGGLFGKANLKELAKELYLDSFIISYFRVMPTDGRFKRLTQRQKMLLYYMVMFAPSGDMLRSMGTAELRKDAVKFTDTDKKLLDGLGIDMEKVQRELNNMTEVFM